MCSNPDAGAAPTIAVGNSKLNGGTFMAKIDQTLNPDECQTLGGSPQFALGFGTYIGCLLPDQSNEGPSGANFVGPFIVLNIAGPRFASPGEDISSRVHILVSNDGDE